MTILEKKLWRSSTKENAIALLESICPDSLSGANNSQNGLLKLQKYSVVTSMLLNMQRRILKIRLYAYIIVNLCMIVILGTMLFHVYVYAIIATITMITALTLKDRLSTRNANVIRPTYEYYVEQYKAL